MNTARKNDVNRRVLAIQAKKKRNRNTKGKGNKNREGDESTRSQTNRMRYTKRVDSSVIADATRSSTYTPQWNIMHISSKFLIFNG
ncbi:hypothetical protein L798_07644 [Zootermopsis nevadensis]|uniref:Uncharacterized protein n=1 Tax=Zootermopsis nevadensis TaxID=136037 RepID=A0A067RG90_ZOONE|nr:hypothetical protein L798_07644 [Zootermopsis nevadensis]